jgi:hypothetical protein
VYIVLGEQGRAIGLLRQAVERGRTTRTLLAYAAPLTPLRANVEFRSLVRP